LILLDFINVVMLSQLSDIPVLVFQSYAIFGIVEIIVAAFFIVAGFKILTVLHKIQQKEKRMAWWQYLNPNIPSDYVLILFFMKFGMLVTSLTPVLAVAPSASGKFTSSSETGEEKSKSNSKSRNKQETVDLKEIEVAVHDTSNTVEETQEESSSSSSEEEKNEEKSSPND